MNEMQRANSEFVSQDIGTRRTASTWHAPRVTPMPVKKTRGVSGLRKNASGLMQHRGLVIKTCVCVLVCLTCLLIKVIDTPATKDASQAIQDMVSYDLDLEDSLGKLHFVQNIFPGLTAVFSNSAGTMRYPVQGNVIQNFQEDGLNGVRIHAEANNEVTAAADGILLKRAVSSEFGNYLRIKHPNGVETVYYGLAESPLLEGASIARGDVIGTLTDTGVLYFEVYQNGVVKNPLSFFSVD